MGKQIHQSVIELNGQRFNARTGTMINGVSMPATPIVRPTMTDVADRPRNPRATTASKQIHKATQPGKTLMRHAVKRPSTITDHRTIAMDVVPQKPGQVTLEKFHSVNPERGHRAESVRQNTRVSRFGGELRGAVTLPSKQPMITTQLSMPVQHLTTPLSQHRTGSATAAKILEKGLRSATSHEAVMPKKAKLHHRFGKKLGLSARSATLVTSSMAVLVIGGIFAYQNIPNIAVHYASTKAGISASLPTYQPSGFTVNNHVTYSPGEISVAYKANADNRAYVVTQKTTNWNSDALKEHLMGISGSIPQIYPDSGRTIYLHDSHEADWVNNGVWYSITGNSDLNTDQLIKIATSL